MDNCKCGTSCSGCIALLCRMHVMYMCCRSCIMLHLRVTVSLTILLQLPRSFMYVTVVLTAKDHSLEFAVLVVAVDKMTDEELRDIDRYLVCVSSLAI